MMTDRIFGLLMGLMFGGTLVMAGLADPDRIIAALRLKDLHAIRTIAVFIIVSMLGTWVLDLFGCANFNVTSAGIPLALIGGAIFGIGLALAAYSPATGIAATILGRIDALVAVLGMLVGAGVYLLCWPSIIVPAEKVYNYGKVTLPELTGTTATVWVIPICAVGSLLLFLTRPRVRQIPAEGAKIRGLSLDYRIFGPAVGKDQIESIRTAAFLKVLKNLLLLTAIFCLLALQGAFWLADRDCGADAAPDPLTPTAAAIDDPNSPQTAVAQSDPWTSRVSAVFDELTFDQVSWLVVPVQIVLIVAMALYCMTVMTLVKVTVIGRLGGMKHICLAALLALLAVVLLLPYQLVTGPILLGAIYSPAEIAQWKASLGDAQIDRVLYYLRFSAYPMLILLLALITHHKTRRWNRQVIRNLSASQPSRTQSARIQHI